MQHISCASNIPLKLHVSQHTPSPFLSPYEVVLVDLTVDR